MQKCFKFSLWGYFTDAMLNQSRVEDGTCQSNKKKRINKKMTQLINKCH